MGLAGCDAPPEPDHQQFRVGEETNEDDGGEDGGNEGAVNNAPPSGWGTYVPCPSGDPLATPMFIPMTPMPSLSGSVLDSEGAPDAFIAGCIQEFNGGACGDFRKSTPDECIDDTMLREFDGGNGACSLNLYAKSYDCDALCKALGALGGECRQDQPVVCKPDGTTVDSAYCACNGLIAGSGTDDGGTGGDDATTGMATMGGTGTGSIECDYEPETGTWGGFTSSGTTGGTTSTGTTGGTTSSGTSSSGTTGGTSSSGS
ncbi:MAG: hypothetical protein AAF799_30735 [Myxococcota bacterium]